MITTIAKRIQSRLSRQGLKVTLGDIKTQCELMITDIKGTTEQDILSVIQHFVDNATKLTIVNEDVEPIATEVEETLTSEDVTTNEDLETTSIQNIGGIDGQQLDLVADAQDTEVLPQSSNQVDRSGWYQPAPLATATKSELVSSTAQGLGIALSTQEVETIATNINTTSEDLTDSLDEIKGAIISFISYKASLNSQKIDDTLTEISQVAADKFNQNSEQFTDGLRQINQQMQQQRTDFKSKVKATLSAFAIPAIKAG